MYRRRGEPSWQAIHDRARMRMEDMTDEHLKHIELALARSWRFIGPKPLMLRQLIEDMEAAPPGPEHRQRVQHTLRRAFTRLQKEGRRADEYEIAVATFLDGQIDTATRYLTPDVALRPWGQP